MVQNKEEEVKMLVNGEIRKEENGETKTNENASVDEDSEDEDDYLDYLLMVPPLDNYSNDRNKGLVSKTLLDLCSAIESRKEYPKIRQELLLQNSCVPKIEETPEIPEIVKEKDTEDDQHPKIAHITEDISEPPQQNLLNGDVKKEDSPSTSTSTEDDTSTSQECNDQNDDDMKIVPEVRRQSVRLKKAEFVPGDQLPSINDQFFVCRRCTIFFKTRKLRRLHNLSHHPRKEVVPQQITPQRRRRSSNSEPFICDLCSKIFKQKVLLRSHMNSHLSEPKFFCTHCPYASKRNPDMKKHFETHHNPDTMHLKVNKRKRKCDKCDLIVDGRKALRIHIKQSHPGTKQVRVFTKQCEKCTETLNSVKLYKIHLKLVHPEPVDDIRCEKCNKKFKTNFRLKKHIAKFAALGSDCRAYKRQNGEVSSFDCEHCEKKFTLKSHLTLHMKKHSSLTCKKCNQVFKNNLNLKWHEFSHLEIDPKCTNCLKSFTSEQSFSLHLKKKSCLTNGTNH